MFNSYIFFCFICNHDSARNLFTILQNGFLCVTMRQQYRHFFFILQRSEFVIYLQNLPPQREPFTALLMRAKSTIVKNISDIIFSEMVFFFLRSIETSNNLSIRFGKHFGNWRLFLLALRRSQRPLFLGVCYNEFLLGKLNVLHLHICFLMSLM